MEVSTRSPDLEAEFCYAITPERNRNWRHYEMRLNGKVCVITGTGGSMGRAAAIRFAAEGASVVGCDANPDAAQETLEIVRAAGGRMSSLHPVDLTAMAGCQKLVEFAIREHGR